MTACSTRRSVVGAHAGQVVRCAREHTAVVDDHRTTDHRRTSHHAADKHVRAF